MSTVPDGYVMSDERPGLLRALWEQRILTAVYLAVFVAIGVAAGLAESPAVVAQSRVGLADPRTTFGTTTLPNSDVQARFVSDQAAFAESDAVLAPAATAVDLQLDTLRSQVSALTQSGTNTFVVQGEAATGPEARASVDATVAAYRAQSAARYQAQAQAQLTALDAAQAALAAQPTASTPAALQSLVDQRLGVQVRADTIGDGVLFADPARVLTPGLLSRPELRNGLVGLVLGLLVASALVLARGDRPAARPARRTGPPVRRPLPGSAVSPGAPLVGAPGRQPPAADPPTAVPSTADRPTAEPAAADPSAVEPFVAVGPTDDPASQGAAAGDLERDTGDDRLRLTGDPLARGPHEGRMPWRGRGRDEAEDGLDHREPLVPGFGPAEDVLPDQGNRPS